MQAFHNDPAIKDKYLARVAAHREADELIKGMGWQDGKGCAIGCTLEAYNHALYETELGIPQMLAQLEDAIFEGLPNGKAQAWPERFLSAIEPGADLSVVGWKFLHWLLTQSGIGAYDHESVCDAVKQCADVLEPLTRGEPVDERAAENARNAAENARSAAESAGSAARSAAWSAAKGAAWSAKSAENARSAESAAKGAAWSAKSAENAKSAGSARSSAWSARSAAESATWSAWSAAWSARSAAENATWSASERTAWETMANQLIRLLEEAR